MQITKEVIQNIGKIFEKGLQDDYLSKSLIKIIEHEREKTAHDVNTLKADLAGFEGRYNMSSAEFYDSFEKGELGDSGDYFEWSAIFRMYTRAQERLSMLEGAF